MDLICHNGTCVCVMENMTRTENNLQNYSVGIDNA